MRDKKRILIIDDHPLFREGIKAIIQNDERYDVVGEAGTAGRGIELAAEMKVDLVVVDITLPDQNGFELIRSILRVSDSICILVVSMHNKIDYIVKSFQAGALGYLTKESASERLLQGIETVLKGEFFMDSSISGKVIQKLARLPDGRALAKGHGNDILTQREQEVMVLVANGLSSQKIAEKLYISTKTVENHRSRIMRKLKAGSVIELARHAARLGLVDLDLWKK